MENHLNYSNSLIFIKSFFFVFVFFFPGYFHLTFTVNLFPRLCLPSTNHTTHTNKHNEMRKKKSESRDFPLGSVCVCVSVVFFFNYSSPTQLL